MVLRTLTLPVFALLVLGCPRGGEPTDVPEPAPLSTGPAASPPQSPAVATPTGPLRYRGEVARPVGGPLLLYVELLPHEQGHAGTITIPSQGAYQTPLDGVVAADGVLRFGLSQAGAVWSATLQAEGTTTECKLEQAGIQLPCTLTPIDAAALAAVTNPDRPQTPAPPFPYQAEPVEYDNAFDQVHLAGTLTLPPGPGPHPAALLITGSGAQDRDETLLGHKPFLVLADHLSRHGIAVLRVDDRGVGGSTGVVSESVGAALARDVAAGVAWLREHERIDPARVGLIGHSEGGVLGPRAAALDPKIAFVVMLAGTGVPGHEVLREQSVAILRANGAPDATVEMARHRQAKALQVVLQERDPAKARTKLEQLLGSNVGQIDQMSSPWFRDFVTHDPRPALEKLRCPVLVLNGELDLQVLADQNVPAIEQALRNNRRVTVHRLPGLNHLFQHATTGSPSEYASIAETIDPAVLTLIHEWILAELSGKNRRTRKRR